jgi:hypothetical protein
MIHATPVKSGPTTNAKLMKYHPWWFAWLLSQAESTPDQCSDTKSQPFTKSEKLAKSPHKKRKCFTAGLLPWVLARSGVSAEVDDSHRAGPNA